MALKLDFKAIALYSYEAKGINLLRTCTGTCERKVYTFRNAQCSQ